MWYKVNKRYVGTSLVRPNNNPFTPDANTLAYFPLGNNANDNSWHGSTISATEVTKQTLWYEIAWPHSKINFTSAVKPVFFMGWVKYIQPWSTHDNYIWWLYYTGMRYHFTHASSSMAKRFSFYDDNWWRNYPTNQLDTQMNTWYHIAMWCNSSLTQFKCFMNWDLKASWNVVRSSTWDWSTAVELSWHETHFIISEVVIESDFISDSVIQNHYNLTKSKYWL